ncbi:GTP-binding protein ypt7 [Plakobranchus ocellatus]|uniref:GTP-binding protein ypt7 n=1 Tax=Plakobranchus ocellatus TaxID=259542 RepID=A0AAV4C5U6_9GAST|nr:GTP-binding protein ypt7 [Plakobranchus ocellatus]
MGTGSSAQSLAVRKAVEVPSLKIAVVGDPQVGKTSVLSRYIHNQFSPVYVQTQKVAIDNVVKKFNVPGHAKVPVTFWDIPGQEDLPLHSSYFTDLDAVIVVVDLSIPENLESALLWRQTVLGSASFTSNKDQLITKDKKTKHSEKEEPTRGKEIKNTEDIPFLLLGNKLDFCQNKKIEIDESIMLNAPEKGDDAKGNEEENLIISNRVQQLEEIATRGFEGSVTVSALNNDLSVHAAIQSFLRHLLEKRNLVQRKWLARDLQQPENKPIGRPRYNQEPQLKTVGIQEIDAKFSVAEDILYRVSSLQRYQEDSLQKFSFQCVEAGVITNNQEASMQNCLVALRDKLADLDLKLQLKLNDEFCHLEVKASTEDAQLDKNLRYAIKTFNKEYAAVTKAILAEFPVAEIKLAQLESQVDQLCKTQMIKQESRKDQSALKSTSLQDRQEGCMEPSTTSRSETVFPLTTSHVNKSSFSGDADSGIKIPGVSGTMRVGAVVERNRAVLRHASHECHDCLAHIQRSVKQAKAAFVW